MMSDLYTHDNANWVERSFGVFRNALPLDAARQIQIQRNTWDFERVCGSKLVICNKYIDWRLELE